MNDVETSLLKKDSLQDGYEKDFGELNSHLTNETNFLVIIPDAFY